MVCCSLMPTLNSTGNTRRGLPSLISSGKVWKTSRGNGTSTMKWSLGKVKQMQVTEVKPSTTELQFETLGKLCNLICATGYGKSWPRTPPSAWEQKINTSSYIVKLSLGGGKVWIQSRKHMNSSHRRPHTNGWRSPSSSVLASVIWNTTLCRSEMPTSMSSSMPTSSPEGHVTNTLLNKHIKSVSNHLLVCPRHLLHKYR